MTDQLDHTEIGMLCVYDGRTCIGSLIRRGKEGVEAFDTDTKSLGVYPSEDAAATVVWRHAHGQEAA
jgi:hypothetical protein